MILDALLTVSSAQTVTTSAVSTNTVDLGVARDIGEGTALYAYFTVDQAVTSGTAGSTVEFQVIGSANADLSSGVVLGTSGPIVKTALTAGAKVAVRINPQLAANGYRYLGTNYSVSATLTAGKFTASFVETIQDGSKYYASAITVA